jgi:subtilase family serine protease
MNKKEKTVISKPHHADPLKMHRAHHSKTSSGGWRGHGRFGLVPIALALAVIALVTGASAETLRPLCSWVTSGPAQPGVPAASYAPDGTTFLGVLHAYFPADITAAYGVDALHTEGWTGTGQTIVIVDSYGSPTALADLQTFSTSFSLPAPDLTIVYPDGKPTYSKAMKGIEANWAMETSLDLQWAHVIAPDAKLVLIAANPAESAGVQGFPSMFKGIQYAIAHYPGSPISQSFGCAEQSFQAADAVQLEMYEKTYQQAAAARCTVLAASGDWGTANTDKQGKVYPFQTVVWPASSPSVTAVGGTWLQYGWEWNPLTTLSDLLANGALGNSVLYAYFNSDSTAGQVEAMWREDWYALPTGAAFVTSGGLSAIFPTPSWQSGLPSSLLQGRRGVPDVAWNAAIDGGVVVMCSPLGGWQDVGGTSAATPQIAGLVALANQLRAAGSKGPLGHLAPALYALPSTDFNDIVPQTFGTGANAVTLDNNQRYTYLVPGFPCLPGYDLTTGLGSPKAYGFVHDLATTP